MDMQSMKRVASKSWNSDWKEKFRENCLQRVKKERSQLLWKIRSAGKSSQVPQEGAESEFGHIITDEVHWRNKENGAQNPHAGIDYDGMLWEYEQCETLSELTQEDYEELMVAMESILYEEMQTEIQEKGATLFEELNNSCIQKNPSPVDLGQQFQSNKDGLLCPICKAGHLHQIQHLIYCNCGHLRLDVGTEKSFYKDDLKNYLSSTMTWGVATSLCFVQTTDFLLQLSTCSAALVRCLSWYCEHSTFTECLEGNSLKVLLKGCTAI